MGVVFLILLLVVMTLALGSLSMDLVRGNFLWQNRALKDRYFGGGGGYQSVLFWISVVLVFGFVLGVIFITLKMLLAWYIG